jgi:hypothetical protein
MERDFIIFVLPGSVGRGYMGSIASKLPETTPSVFGSNHK